ncbi:stalk domain-containing protein [Bacilliculturomica massiliensis]|uniref:stalk domain-containing protein n=1 Tax=Bacilliculturomica massiliensis TaxID=1917867 RepID=UPI001031B31D|nr:stalk domain-containing protein [Bacilliculturomica massiliensis]
MKKEKLKGFISGVVVTTMVFALSISAFAASGSKTIQVAYDNIKIYVNEKLTPMVTDSQTVEPFTYQGRTYVPLNAVATALGQKVSWDGNTNSIYIGTQPDASKTTPSTPATPTKPVNAAFSRSNPAPIGSPQAISVKSYTEQYTATIKVNSVLRGYEAWVKIRSANQFNDAPPEGYEYILVNATVTADAVADDGSLDVNKYDFAAYSSSNAEYATQATVVPEPALDGKIFTGGSQTGNLAVLVKKDDPAPKLAYGISYDGTGGVWFKLSEDK